MMRTGFHTAFLHEYPVLDAVRLVADHGYDYVELNAETMPWCTPHITPQTDARVRREIAEILPVSSISAHHADYGNADPDLRAKAVQFTQDMMDFAVDVGTDIVHVIPGEHSTSIPLLVDSLRRGVDAAAQRGVTLALEPIVNQVIGTADQTAAVLAQVPGLAVSFDASHLQVMDGEVARGAQLLGKHVAHVALKDASGDPLAWRFDPLGDGVIDFVAMLQTLQRAGFDGVVSVEHESHVFADDKRGPEQVLAESKTFLDDVLRQVAQVPAETH
ncbi:sugar phosphate isomerase/epimerase family protein [Gordonia sp. DT30]|uniref:sugar phosphate isomerase/epimerase family protein n=1 Tax=Gordonia sp. DT30 TaxID=3416546 RepID=UPI003CF8B3FB